MKNKTIEALEKLLVLKEETIKELERQLKLAKEQQTPYIPYVPTPSPIQPVNPFPSTPWVQPTYPWYGPFIVSSNDLILPPGSTQFTVNSSIPNNVSYHITDTATATCVTVIPFNPKANQYITDTATGITTLIDPNTSSNVTYLKSS